MKPTFTYHTDRDEELWLLEAPGWVMPLRVSFGEYDGQPHFHALNAIQLGFTQVAVLEARMADLGARPARRGWILPQAAIEQMTKAPGITPEFYFKWDGVAAERGGLREEVVGEAIRKGEKAKADATPFLAHVARTSGIDIGSLQLVWLAVTQSIPGWLTSGNSMNLGCCQLVSVPYRRNWKQLLLARCPGLKKSLLLTGAKQKAALVLSSASRFLRLTELTECRTRGERMLFTHTIEVLHDPSWEKTCEQVELEAAGRLGSIGYVKRWANRVAQLESTIYDLLAAATSKETAPTCRVLWRRGSRGMRFVQASPSVLGVPPVVDCDDGGNTSVDDFLSVTDTAAHLEEAFTRVLEMPDVRPKESDVRPPRGDGIPNDDKRVLVLRTSVSEAAREGLLDGGNGLEG